MTTYFIDPVSGNDSNDCLSFASAGKTLNNVALNAALIGGDEVRIVESPSVPITGTNAKFNYSDPVSSPYSVTAASNTSPIQITTSVPNDFVTGDYVYLSAVGGNLGSNGIWKITRLTDTSFTLDNSIGTASFTSGGQARKRTGSIVEFSTPQVKNISLCGNQFQTAYPYCSGNWTASTGCTCTQNIASSYISGNAQQIGVTASFTTGKIAYQNLGTTLNLSAWTHVNVLFSFVTSSVSTPADGIYYLALCSDTTGNTIVDTLPLNNVMVSATFAINMKLCIQKQGGGNLGSSIQSVALYRSSAASGTANILIENITAGLAPTTSNVNVRSLLMYMASPAGWYQLAGINQDYAILNIAGFNITGGVPVCYPGGSSEFAATNKMEGFDAGNLALGANYQTLTFTSPSSNISFSGGWTRASNMTVQSTGGLSIWSCGTLLGTGLNVGTKSNVSFDSIGFANFSNGITTGSSSSNIYISNCYLSSCTLAASLVASTNINFGIKPDNTPGICWLTQNTGGIAIGANLSSIQYTAVVCNANNASLSVGGSGIFVSQVQIVNCGSGSAISHSAPCSRYSQVSIYNCYGSSLISLASSSGFSRFEELSLISKIIYGNTALNFVNSNGNIVINSSIDACVGGVAFSGCNSNSVFNTTITNCTNPVTTSNGFNNNLNKCSGFNFPYANYYSSSSIGPYVTMNNCRDLSNALVEGVYYLDNCYVKKTDAVSHSGTYSWGVYIGAYSGLYGWKNENCPVKNQLSKIQCTANRTYTVSVWVLRTDGLNQNAYLMCMGGQIAGVTNDVVSSNASASDNVWEQLTLPSFTPTENGVVQIVGCNYGSSTSLIHWDDINIVEA